MDAKVIKSSQSAHARSLRFAVNRRGCLWRGNPRARGMPVSGTGVTFGNCRGWRYPPVTRAAGE